MSNRELKPGILNITIDLELLWGLLDCKPRTKETLILRGRESIPNLLNLFQRYQIPATWAVVGALLQSKNGNYDAFVLRGLHRSDCSFLRNKNLWYAEDLIERILEDKVGHEIGSHSFSHLPFGSPDLSVEVAKKDFEIFRSICKQKLGFNPVSFVYPRHSVGFRELLPLFGFKIYRGSTLEPFIRYPAFLRKSLRFGIRAFGIASPVSIPVKEKDGLVHLPASLHFALREGIMGKLITSYMLAKRAKEGVMRAVREGGVFSIYFHDHNIGLNPTAFLSAIKEVLDLSSQLREEGKLRIMTMKDIANLIY